MNIHYLQHVPFEGPARIKQWAASRGHSLSSTRLDQDQPLPAVETIDSLVILGGPMNIYAENQYPWLVPEKRWIEQVIHQEKVILGICLGAQLIADVLGAKVVTNPDQEIGWFPVELTQVAQTSPVLHGLPTQFNAFHWHGDTFELPAGAVHIAQSQGCHNQAFLCDQRILALQFHLEATPSSVQALLDHSVDQLVAGQYIQKPDQMLSQADRFQASNNLLDRILDRLYS
jgi:GMP synthase (glutamine-hydrolysing)